MTTPRALSSGSSSGANAGTTEASETTITLGTTYVDRFQTDAIASPNIPRLMPFHFIRRHGRRATARPLTSIIGWRRASWVCSRCLALLLCALSVPREYSHAGHDEVPSGTGIAPGSGSSIYQRPSQSELYITAAARSSSATRQRGSDFYRKK
jgi:hypothetical protein